MRENPSQHRRGLLSDAVWGRGGIASWQQPDTEIRSCAVGAHPGPLHFLSVPEGAGSVQQLQKKPTQQHIFMKRRMRSE